jgi:hypothetical protein
MSVLSFLFWEANARKEMKAILFLIYKIIITIAQKKYNYFKYRDPGNNFLIDQKVISIAS